MYCFVSKRVKQTTTSTTTKMNMKYNETSVSTPFYTRAEMAAK